MKKVLYLTFCLAFLSCGSYKTITITTSDIKELVVSKTEKGYFSMGERRLSILNNTALKLRVDIKSGTIIKILNPGEEYALVIPFTSTWYDNSWIIIPVAITSPNHQPIVEKWWVYKSHDTSVAWVISTDHYNQKQLTLTD